MTSKHYRWQTRWALDRQARQARHVCGLVVSFGDAPGSLPQPENGPETLQALAAKNGPHNAPIMLRRLLQEASELYQQAPSHAAR